MLKILLAPSETKLSGGETSFSPQSLLFPTLLPYRTKILHTYINILQQNNLSVLSKMFGLKKESDILSHKTDIIHELTLKAIERYSGVAFDYLDYASLETSQKAYIDKNVILFSNLLGPIRASDLIPNYKLKQGQKVGEIAVEKFYKEYASALLDEALLDDEILDLRAGFYDKFYTPNKPYTTLKFIKEGKVVSHWAKAYRGIFLRACAKANIESIDALKALPIEGLTLQSISTKKNKTEICYELG